MRQLIYRTRLQRFETLVGFGCLLAGTLAPLLGVLLLAVEWAIGKVDHPWLHFASTSLFVVGIPLILFAGVCLDWAEHRHSEAARNHTRTQNNSKRSIHTAAHFSPSS